MKLTAPTIGVDQLLGPPIKHEILRGKMRGMVRAGPLSQKEKRALPGQKRIVAAMTHPGRTVRPSQGPTVGPTSSRGAKDAAGARDGKKAMGRNPPEHSKVSCPKMLLLMRSWARPLFRQAFQLYLLHKLRPCRIRKNRLWTGGDQAALASRLFPIRMSHLPRKAEPMDRLLRQKTGNMMNASPVHVGGKLALDMIDRAVEPSVAGRRSDPLRPEAKEAAMRQGKQNNQISGRNRVGIIPPDRRAHPDIRFGPKGAHPMPRLIWALTIAACWWQNPMARAFALLMLSRASCDWGKGFRRPVA